MIDELVLGLSAVAARVALFVVKKGSFVGWACNEAFGKQALFRQVIVPSDVANVLTTAVSSGLYLGPLPAGLAHRELQAFMGTASQDIAVIPIKVLGHAALIAVIDDLVRHDDRKSRTAEQLARVAGEALARTSFRPTKPTRRKKGWIGCAKDKAEPVALRTLCQAARVRA